MTPNYEFQHIRRIPENCEGGFASRIVGTADGTRFVVEVWCEHDGRDVDITHIRGHDVREDMDFFGALCEHKPWAAALNKDYKRWEAELPQQ